VKDFDAERIARPGEDRVFKVNGAEFHLKPALAARRLAQYEDIVFSAETGAGNTIDEMDSLIRDSLEPGQEAAWQQVSDVQAERPLTLGDYERIVNYLRTVMSGRPFVSLSGSGGTPETTGTTSTAESPSPEAS
jgi:hypothetical protein